jgi:hypothetical protein
MSMTTTVTPSLRDDLLTGADAIANYLGWPRWRVYYKQNDLPIGRVGQTLIARKSELERRLSGALSEKVA